MLNYAPSIDIETGIPEYINWFLKQKFYLDNLKINTTVHLDTVRPAKVPTVSIKNSI